MCDLTAPLGMPVGWWWEGGTHAVLVVVGGRGEGDGGGIFESILMDVGSFVDISSYAVQEQIKY